MAGGNDVESREPSCTLTELGSKTELLIGSGCDRRPMHNAGSGRAWGQAEMSLWVSIEVGYSFVQTFVKKHLDEVCFNAREDHQLDYLYRSTLYGAVA